MKPFKLQAPLKDYIWGGQALKQRYHKPSDLAKVAESWEVSCHPDGVSIIASGEHQGMSLDDYCKRFPQACGSKSQAFEQFPILIKLIDAQDNLSIQVHPDNEYALRVEGEYGKTEMWYVVEAQEGAELIYGFNQPLTPAQFADHIQANTLEQVVNHVPVKAGDVFFIEAGTLHGIGKGIVIAEIQQNSNTTYRVYDYGRIGVDGNPRPLHVEKAKEVTSLTVPKQAGKPQGEVQQADGVTRTLLSSCNYFTVERYTIENTVTLTADETSFQAILVVQGDLTLRYGDERLTLLQGESAFVPASSGDYTLEGNGTFLQTMIGN